MVDYLIKLEVSLNTIKNTPLPRVHQKELLNKLEIEDINNVSELLNDPIGLYKAEQIQKGHIMPTRTSKFLIYTNYRSGLEFARNYSARTSLKPSSELLLHINKILLKKVFEEWDTGKIRKFSEKPNEAYDTWYSLRDYYAELNVEEYFNEVLEWTANSKYAIHRMIRMGVLLFELIDKAPLFAGNQLTSVILLQSLSKEYGYNPDSMFSYARALNYIADDLQSGFKMAKSKRDLTTFIEAFLYTCSMEMLNIENSVTATFDKKIRQGGKLRSKFNTRQIKVLEYLENVEKITREEYTNMMGVSFMTSYRDLKHLVEEKYLSSHGTGRGTYYTLQEDKRGALNDKADNLEVFGEE